MIQWWNIPWCCRSHSATGRATAAAALLQFLLDYPLSPNRLQNHVAFLLTNTSYEYETGRLQALEMLQQVCVCVCVV
jgi:U3 small nucleolar RNA-associated protein 20